MATTHTTGTLQQLLTQALRWSGPPPRRASMVAKMAEALPMQDRCTASLAVPSRAVVEASERARTKWMDPAVQQQLYEKYGAAHMLKQTRPGASGRTGLGSAASVPTAFPDPYLLLAGAGYGRQTTQQAMGSVATRMLPIAVPMGPYTELQTLRHQESLAREAQAHEAFFLHQGPAASAERFHRYHREQFQEILELLNQLAPAQETKYLTRAELQQRQERDQQFQLPTEVLNQEHRLMSVYRTGPPPPPQTFTHELFDRYILLLARARFFDSRHLQQFRTGVVPRMLLQLHSHDHAALRPFRTVDTYNNLIHFFGVRGGNWDVAKKLYAEMAVDGVAPNTSTFNTLLRLAARVQCGTGVPSNLKHAGNVLREMRRAGCRANSDTYRNTYLMVDHLPAREQLLSQMVLAVYPNMDMYTLVFRDVVRQRFARTDAGSVGDAVRELTALLRVDMVHYNGTMVDCIIEEVLARGHYKLAYAVFTDHFTFEREGEPGRLLAQYSTLLVFLEAFARAGRVDLCFGVQQTFRMMLQNRVRVDHRLFQWLLVGLYNAGITDNWRTILRVILYSMGRVCGRVRYVSNELDAVLNQFIMRDRYEDRVPGLELPDMRTRVLLSLEEQQLYANMKRGLEWTPRSGRLFEDDVMALAPEDPRRRYAHVAGFRGAAHRPRVLVRDIAPRELDGMDAGAQQAVRRARRQMDLFERGVKYSAIHGTQARRARIERQHSSIRALIAEIKEGQDPTLGVVYRTADKRPVH